MVLSAVAFRGWFRLYSFATIAVVVAFGMAASFAMRGLEQNDTPWVGGFERINAYAYLAWLAVLAVIVTRGELRATPSSTERAHARLARLPNRGGSERRVRLRHGARIGVRRRNGRHRWTDRLALPTGTRDPRQDPQRRGRRRCPCTGIEPMSTTDVAGRFRRHVHPGTSGHAAR